MEKQGYAGAFIQNKKAIKKIRRSKPFRAFDIIINELCYGEYLKRNAGFSTVFSTLKQLADGTKTVSELKKNLKSVKHEIEHSYKTDNDAAVWLLTLHGSKGLEFDKVILIDLIDGLFPSEKALIMLPQVKESNMRKKQGYFMLALQEQEMKCFLSRRRNWTGKP